MTTDQTADAREVGCLDCGLPYASFPLDVNLPRGQWLLIHPDEHGVLCAACIVKRGAAIPGVAVAHMTFEVSPACESCRYRSGWRDDA